MRNPRPLLQGRRRLRGFTLIELMIAVALVAILVATALPSYSSYARRSIRAEAQSFLTSVAARQQQFLVDTRVYAASLDAMGMPVPARIAGAYSVKLEVVAGPPQTFVLTAEPKTDQAKDGCGTMTLNQAGAKTAAKAGCW
jgi:type IV pilus assembly protein PilE